MGSLALCCSARSALAQDDRPQSGADPRCPRCAGVGRIPVVDAKPLVWVKGTPLPRWETAVGQRLCPVCQVAGDSGAIAAELKQQFEDAIEANRHWEERTGWKLACVVTRHAAVHTQLSSAQARAVGMALESLTLQLQRITSSLTLTPTHPDTLGLVLLWEKVSWEKFRKVMEGLYTPQELGNDWGPARDYNAYDHFVTPHVYETPQTIRTRPPTCGATFIAARRQLQTATDRRAPFWLLEGFAAYGDHAVHKVNRWFTVYDIKQVPVGDWLAEAKKLAADSKLRPWREMVQLELRDWESEDRFQTMAIATYLLEAEPVKFLDMVRRLKSGDQGIAALEDAYRVTLDELEQRFTRWLLARR
jgi:hypothetical protein